MAHTAQDESDTGQNESPGGRRGGHAGVCPDLEDVLVGVPLEAGFEGPGPPGCVCWQVGDPVPAGSSVVRLGACEVPLIEHGAIRPQDLEAGLLARPLIPVKRDEVNSVSGLETVSQVRDLHLRTGRELWWRRVRCQLVDGRV